MMKNKFVFAILLLGVLLFPFKVEAAETTKKLYINIDIKADGSIDVKEMAELSGEYNGRLRNIQYANSSARKFTGVYEDFKGSDIYNGSRIDNLKVYEVPKDFSKSSFKDKTNEYKLVSSASSGDTGLYERIDTVNGFDLKIYNPSSRPKGFYLEYTVKDVVVVHNDIAEIAWNILGDSYNENIDDFQVWINLPNKDSDLRVFLKGNENTLNGSIKKVGEKTAYIKFDFLGANNAITARMLFDKTQVPKATKVSGVAAKESIIKVETEAANEANAIREKIKFQNNATIIITIIWYIVLLILLILFLMAKKKNLKSDFTHDYLRDLPNTYGPEILEYLLKKSVTDTGLSASLLNIVDKKVLKIEVSLEKKKEYTLLLDKNVSDEVLTEQEKKLVNLFINDIGDGEKITSKEIKNYGKNSVAKAQKLINYYNDWKATASNIGNSYKFFTGTNKVQTLAVITGLLSFIIMYFNLRFETGFIPGYLIVVAAIALILYTMKYNFKTKEGALEFAKWMAFKKFLLDFGTMDEKELPEIKLWGKYLVYATVLGCADKVEKAMKLKLDKMSVAEGSPLYLDYYFYNTLLYSNMRTSINSSVATSVSASRSSIANSYSSSGSGSGGGSSFGGGSFGGGGGGGRF